MSRVDDPNQDAPGTVRRSPEGDLYVRTFFMDDWINLRSGMFRSGEAVTNLGYKYVGAVPGTPAVSRFRWVSSMVSRVVGK